MILSASSGALFLFLDKEKFTTFADYERNERTYKQ